MGKNFATLLLCILGIAAGVVLNHYNPLNFTFYFILCIFALALNILREKIGLLIPWTITATASVLVTLNYLHPDISVYSNADYHVLAMQGVDKQDSILLIGEDHTQSLFDKEEYHGLAYITPSKKGNNNCTLHYNLQGEPLFSAVEGDRTGKLINKAQMPYFRKQLSLQNDSIRCDITFSTYSKHDSTKVEVIFKHLTKNTTSSPYHPSFSQPINIGYNIYDLLHSGISYNDAEESMLNVLRGSFVVRDFDDKDKGVYHLTCPIEMEQLKLTCDGQPYQFKNEMQETELNQETYFYIGIGSWATRPMSASYQNGNICLRYQFPYLSNFPRLSDHADIKENQQTIIAITSQTKPLIKSNVNEAFYYPLFESEDNEYNFSGSLTYRINDSKTPFNTNILDNQSSSNTLKGILTSPNGATWHFRTYNLREESPITGTENYRARDYTILGLIILLLFIAYFSSKPWVGDHKSHVMMMVWLFAIPLFVMRIYLLWRIAVFPPVSDITLSEFLRYRMELPGALNNPLLLTVCIWLLPLLLLIRLPKKWQRALQDAWLGKEGKILYNLLFFGVFAVTISALAFDKAGLPILLAVVSFLINEYIATRWLSVYHRLLSAAAAFTVLFIKDPGYSIMFFIFLCIYYTIILYGYLRYKNKRDDSKKRVSIVLFISLIITLIGSIIFLPLIVSWLYSSSPLIFGLSVSRFIFIIIPLALGCLLLWTINLLWEVEEKWKIIGLLSGFAIVLCLTVVSATWAYNSLQSENLHFKYRAIIHTQNVGEIMQDEKYDHRNSQRLLNASQNQWFLQYHINKGNERMHDDGIINLLPHFKKGVTWNTQISDVILSRYVIGELSSTVPFVMILLSFIFLLRIFQIENSSPAGRSITFAIGLLFFIQSTFEWMAVTNRTIFFGQDFPFLSQNARFTILTFGIWLMLLIYYSCHEPNEEYDLKLRDSQNYFTKPSAQLVFTIVSFLIFICIFKWGNNYETLYADKKVQGDKSNAEEFNISTAMTESARQLSEINLLLSEYPVTGKKLENNEDISSLVKDIEDKTHLSEYVETLKEEGRINEFTFSLYQAFVKNLKRRNSNGNIIHLRHHDENSYELALNRNYFSVQSPEFNKKAWRGNIYSQVSSPLSQKSLSITELPGMVVYSIPKFWLPPHSDYAIVDDRIQNGARRDSYHKVVHKDMSDYEVSTSVFPLSPKDILEFKDKGKNTVLTYQYGRDEQDLLVKNMIINGRRKFYYPEKDRIFWLRDFSNLVAFSKQGASSNDSVFVTIDSKLTATVIDTLRYYNGKDCSVVALDGRGNVRLMADYKPSGIIDPNNEELINELAIQSYMNPNPETDETLFGNLNLCYMKPGPGSSLKPITYAAVTSQSQDIDWSELELMNPYYANRDIVQINDSYYEAQKYGPDYKYSALRPFKSIANDEGGSDKKDHLDWINNIFYLSKSSNYYNALVTYLGHYDNLKNAQNSIFTVSNSTEDFPRFRIGAGGKIYTFRNSPNAISNQILFDGLTKNFKMPTFTGYTDTLRYEFVGTHLFRKNNLESKQWLPSHFSWVFPQESTVYDYEMRDSVMTPAERLRQYTLGADPVKVTPLKMAEMYGKLYSLHPDFHATVVPRESGFTEPWLDRNGNASEFLDFYRNNLFRGMANCVQTGTARNLTKENKGYHFYAKTGTLSLGKGYNDDRMLAIIISNKDLLDSKVTSLDDYKYMVVYFRFKQLDPNSSSFFKTVNSVIKSIINSTSFNIYMK